MTLLDTAISHGKLGRFLAAAKVACLLDRLQGPNTLTVFAPNDEAFRRTSDTTMRRLIEDPGYLRCVLLGHMSAGPLMAADLARISGMRTLLGERLPVLSAQSVHIGGGRIVCADLLADNGVLHTIDRVLIPGLTASPAGYVPR